MSERRVFLGDGYLRSMREYYPELLSEEKLQTTDKKLHIGILRWWTLFSHLVGVDPSDRFEELRNRAFSMKRNVWKSMAFEESPDGFRRLAASSCYKGLINLTPPSDLVLYSSLIWELRPRTIVEFGAMQGGSSLWFADQLDACGGPGEVHSFELLDKCIHPSAAHPRLTFHRADLSDVDALDLGLFARLPHPWLVIDDAHESPHVIASFVGKFLQSGDYYVVEDVFLQAHASLIVRWVRLCEELGLVVDTKYTDAFGYNVTCSPNAWFKKR